MLVLPFVVMIMSVLVFPVFAYEEPDNFRGIKWGASPDEAKEIIREQRRQRGVKFDRQGFGEPPHKFVTEIVPKDGVRTREFDQTTFFGFYDTVGEAGVNITLRFKDNKFVQAELRFVPGFFSILEAAFKERYGAPTSEAERELQNRAGAKFLNKQIRWLGQNVNVRLEKYGSTVTEGTATITQAEFEKAQMREFKEKTKGAGKDL